MCTWNCEKKMYNELNMAKKKNAKSFTECVFKGVTYIIRCNPKNKPLKLKKFHRFSNTRVDFKTKK